MTIEALNQNAENIYQLSSKLSSLIKQKDALISINREIKNRAEKRKNEFEAKKLEEQIKKIKLYLINSFKNVNKLCNEELVKNA